MVDVPGKPRPDFTGEINAIAEAMDADIFVFNYEVHPAVANRFLAEVANRRRRKNVVLVLTTEGGSADAAFRLMRCLQASYTEVVVAVFGWCKSAGTLMCVGGHRLFIGDAAELGPLDVQIAKADEMDEQKSGLVAEAAFEKLQQEAFKFFMSFVRDIGGSEYRVTLRTASEIATKMTIGVIQPIFDKLDPITIGEDNRSTKLAQAYAERLNVHSMNLVRRRGFDALESLLSFYPSHGFVIDRKEASTLFKKVEAIPDSMACIAKHLGSDAFVPRNSRQEQTPRLEYLNAERAEAKKENSVATSKGGRKVDGSSWNRDGTNKLPRSAPGRGSKEPPPKPNGAGRGIRA